MHMVGHAVDAIKQTLVILAEAVDIHIKFAFVFLSNDGSIVMRAEDNVIYQLSVGSFDTTAIER